MDVTYSRTEAVKTDAAEKIRKLFLEAASSTIPAALFIRDGIRILITVIHRNPPPPVNQLQMELPVTVNAKTLEVFIPVFPRFPSSIITLMMNL